MKMTKETATQFFSLYYGGEHHFPNQIKECGHGWAMVDTRGFATYDFYNLTKLVLMAHKYAIRVEIQTYGINKHKICIWQRVRDGKMSERHPTIEDAINNIVLPETLDTI
jgi:hypothetical protein